jgi:1-acyl-sn-glycerol-3-phosphate acyltransferase
MARDVYAGAGALQRRARRVVRPVTKMLWRIRLEGWENIPRSGPAVLCPNHVSFLDSALLMILADREISFVGKAEYLDSWKTRRLFPALGMIPIDRAGGERSAAALEAAEAVLRRGELFGIFPEGTRSRDGMLYKGRTGAARLALKVGCPIVPVGVVGTREIQPPDAKLPRIGRECTIRIGRPMDVGRYRHTGTVGDGGHDEGMLLRRITDELMFEIRELTGQQYRNVYASKRADEGPTAEKSHVGGGGTARNDGGALVPSP